MESMTVSAEALIMWNKLFSSRNQYVDDCNENWMNKFGHHVDENRIDVVKVKNQRNILKRKKNAKRKNKVRKKNKKRIMRHLKRIN